MKEFFSLIEPWISFFRDIGLIVGIPTLIIYVIMLYKQQIEVLKEENNILKLTQYDKALTMINSQKELFENERNELGKKINELEKNGINKEMELKETKKVLAKINGKYELLELHRKHLSTQIEKESIKQFNYQNSENKIRSEALRKLKIYSNNEEFKANPNMEIADYLWASSTYSIFGVGVSQVEEDIMVKEKWIEILDNKNIRITKKGIEAAKSYL